MTPASRIEASFALLAEIIASDRPADAVASAFFRGRRYMGSKDRREVYERIYRILRNWAKLAWKGREDARSMLIACLYWLENKGLAEIEPLFPGDNEWHLPALSKDERAFLAERKSDFAKLPDWQRLEYPQWIEADLKASLGDNFLAEMAAMNREAPLDLRINTLKGTREELLPRISTEGIKAELTPHSPWGLRVKGRLDLNGLPAYKDGLIEVQDEGSQLVALLLDAKPGERVADFCAGAGGKTLAIAAMMENKGQLVALDVSEGRIMRMGERLRRAGVFNVTPKLLSENGGKWFKWAKGSFDRVLVDAPCSGTGTWRRNPDAKWKLRPVDVQELVAKQRDILANAATLLKEGGVLVYATCSLLPEENQNQVRDFLAANPGFVLEKEELLSPFKSGTDGFYAAKLLRKS